MSFVLEVVLRTGDLAVNKVQSCPHESHNLGMSEPHVRRNSFAVRVTDARKKDDARDHARNLPVCYLTSHSVPGREVLTSPLLRIRKHLHRDFE